MTIGYPLVNVNITMEHHHAINGKIHDFDWAMVNSYVSLPEGNPHFDSAKYIKIPIVVAQIQFVFSIKSADIESSFSHHC